MSTTHPNIGGMHRYRIHYRDEGPDLGCPTFTTVRAGYDARPEHRARAARLVAIWDRIDAGEPLDDKAAHAAVRRSSDAIEAAAAAWRAEWARVGKPIDRAV